MTDPHDPDRITTLIIKSTVTQVSSARVLDQAYDLLQAAHAAIDRARSLQRRDVISPQDEEASLPKRDASNPESRGEFWLSAGGSGAQDANPHA
jgi:type II secretory pathway pseudopilin PulG